MRSDPPCLFKGERRDSLEGLLDAHGRFSMVSGYMYVVVVEDSSYRQACLTFTQADTVSLMFLWSNSVQCSSVQRQNRLHVLL